MTSKVKNRSIDKPRLGEKIGFSLEPTFYPANIRRSNVVIDANTTPKGNRKDNSILYTAGWCFPKDGNNS